MTVQAGDHVPYGEGRRALIMAAVHLVAREGLTKLTYRSLAAEAKVTHGTIQHHFASLDDVLEEALSYTAEVTLPAITADSDPNAFYVNLVECVRQHPELQAFQMEMILQSRRKPRLAAYVKKVYRIYDRYTAHALTRLGCPGDEELVQLASAVGDGIIYQLVALGPEWIPNAEAQARSLERLITAYVAAKGSLPAR